MQSHQSAKAQRRDLGTNHIFQRIGLLPLSLYNGSTLRKAVRDKQLSVHASTSGNFYRHSEGKPEGKGLVTRVVATWTHPKAYKHDGPTSPD